MEDMSCAQCGKALTFKRIRKHSDSLCKGCLYKRATEQISPIGCAFCGKFVSKKQYANWKGSQSKSGPYCNVQCSGKAKVDEIKKLYTDVTCVNCDAELTDKRIRQQHNSGKSNRFTCSTFCSQVYSQRMDAHKKLNPKHSCKSCGRLLSTDDAKFCDRWCANRARIGTLDPADLYIGRFDI